MLVSDSQDSTETRWINRITII